MSKQTVIIYEQALNEQARVCLKAEQFLQRIDDMLRFDSPWACENLARAVVDLTILFDRTDIKAKISKQLRELSDTLTQHVLSPYCDKAQTEELLQHLKNYQQFALNIEGRFVDSLRDDPFIKTIKQCLQQPSGPCSHEAPALHRWIAQPYEERYKIIAHWLKQLNPIRAIVTVILHILRESAVFETKSSHAGHYSQNLKGTKDCQLVRVKLLRDSLVFPEISAGRQHLNIRFITINDNKPSHENTGFELSLCH